VGLFYPEVITCKPLEFLAALRMDDGTVAP